ncbi:MAG: acyl-[acyl-carrier-protein]--UDP-N-acetylglucosamine O-acyltransferase, partial [Ottowia sp.]|nr:acyl-[acyl-carrier-protein]--UDP-N-acetylglucosamine O-acyltransferase [Ottowia sp.]
RQAYRVLYKRDHGLGQIKEELAGLIDAKTGHARAHVEVLLNFINNSTRGVVR